jgi:hypothetical protein
MKASTGFSIIRKFERDAQFRLNRLAGDLYRLKMPGLSSLNRRRLQFSVSRLLDLGGNNLPLFIEY